jgi:hypothetical protein
MAEGGTAPGASARQHDANCPEEGGGSGSDNGSSGTDNGTQGSGSDPDA